MVVKKALARCGVEEDIGLISYQRSSLKSLSKIQMWRKLLILLLANRKLVVSATERYSFLMWKTYIEFVQKSRAMPQSEWSCCRCFFPRLMLPCFLAGQHSHF